MDVVFQHLSAGRRTVFLAHGLGPNPTRHASDDGVFWVDPVGEEEAEVGTKFVDVHPSAEVVLDVGEPVGKGERQLRDGVGPRFCNVVAADGDRVEVPHLVPDEVVLDIAHQTQGEFGGEDASVLGLVFLEDVRLNGAANAVEGLGFQRVVRLGVEDLVSGASEKQEAQPVVAFGEVAEVGGAVQPAVVPFGLEHVFDVRFHAMLADVLFAALVDGGVQEEAKHDGSRSVDGHRHARVGRTEVKPAVQLLRIVQAANADP